MYIGMNYIHGDFCPTRPDFGNINPRTKEILGCFPQATTSEVIEAVSSSKKVLLSWSECKNKTTYFYNLYNAICNNQEEISKIIALETGKILEDCKLEIDLSLKAVQYCFEELSCLHSNKILGIISPYTFPFAIIFWNISLPLAEGNTVILKTSQFAPMIGQKVATLMQDAGFPIGVFNLIHGNEEVSTILLNEVNLANRG